MSSTEPQPNTTHTYAHRTQITRYTHTIIHLHTYIYAHRHKQNNIRTQSAHNLHTIFTQSAHTQKQKQTNKDICSTYKRTQKQNTQYRIHRTNREQTQPQHRCITYDLHTYSFDFIVEDYISKNSIIQLYTNYIQTIYILVTSSIR